MFLWKELEIGAEMKNYKLLTSLIFFFPLFIGAFFLLLNPRLDFAESVAGYPFGDAKSWFEKGVSISEGAGINDSHRPLPSIILASWFEIFPKTYMSAKVFCILVYAFTGAILFSAVFNFLTFWPAVLSLLIFTFHPMLLPYSQIIQGEVLGALFGYLFLYYLFIYFCDFSLKILFAAGVFLALSNLCRPLSLTLFPFFVLFIFFNTRKDLRLKGIGIFTAGVFVAVGPWLIRQKYFYNMFSLSTSMNENLFAASDPRYGKWTSDLFDHLPKEFYSMSISEAQKYFMSRFIENLSLEPFFYITNVLKKFFISISPLIFDLEWNQGVVPLVSGICVFLILLNGQRKANIFVKLITLFVLGMFFSLAIFGMDGKTRGVDLRTQIMTLPLEMSLLIWNILTLFQLKFGWQKFQLGDEVFYRKSLSKIMIVLSVLLLMSGIHLLWINTFDSKPRFDGLLFSSERDSSAAQSLQSTLLANPPHDFKEWNKKSGIASGWVTHPLFHMNAGESSHYANILFEDYDPIRTLFILKSREAGDIPVRISGEFVSLYPYEPIYVLGHFEIGDYHKSRGYVFHADKIYGSNNRIVYSRGGSYDK